MHLIYAPEGLKLVSIYVGDVVSVAFVISLLSPIAKTQTCIASLRIPNTAGASPKKRGKRLVICHMVLLVIG